MEPGAIEDLLDAALAIQVQPDAIQEEANAIQVEPDTIQVEPDALHSPFQVVLITLVGCASHHLLRSTLNYVSSLIETCFTYVLYI